VIRQLDDAKSFALSASGLDEDLDANERGRDGALADDGMFPAWIVRAMSTSSSSRACFR
jgi:hypothetical protein